MSNRNSTDYLIHDGIRIVRLIFTALSILLAIPAIAMVIVCVNRASRSYSNKIIRAIVSSLFILKIQFPSQISCVLNSIVLQLLWDPVLPMPIPCVLRYAQFSFIVFTTTVFRQDAPLAVPGPSALYYVRKNIGQQFPKFMTGSGNVVVCNVPRVFHLHSVLCGTPSSLYLEAMRILIRNLGSSTSRFKVACLGTYSDANGSNSLDLGDRHRILLACEQHIDLYGSSRI